MLWVLAKVTRRAVPVFLGIATGFMLLMLSPRVPLLIDFSTRVALGVMHAIAAVCVVTVFVFRIRSKPI